MGLIERESFDSFFPEFRPPLRHQITSILCLKQAQCHPLVLLCSSLAEPLVVSQEWLPKWSSSCWHLFILIRPAQKCWAWEHRGRHLRPFFASPSLILSCTRLPYLLLTRLVPRAQPPLAVSLTLPLCQPGPPIYTCFRPHEAVCPAQVSLCL